MSHRQIPQSMDVESPEPRKQMLKSDRLPASLSCPIVILLSLTAAVAVVTLGCTIGLMTDHDENEGGTAFIVPTASTSLSYRSNLPGMEDTSWATITERAKTKTVNFYMWSPPTSAPHRWAETKLRPALQNLGIKLNRIPALYTECDGRMRLVCDVEAEVEGGKITSGGAVDLVWINGKNFKAMKDAGHLYGPWATLLPNSANFDFTSSAIAYDKGVPIEGLEFPLNIAQAVFIYNKQRVQSPPKTIPQLVSWIKATPGKFTYSNPLTDFSGAALVRHFFYHYAGDAVGSYKDLLGPFDEDLYTARAPAVWAVLNDIESFLYQKTLGGAFYPAKHDIIREYIGNETLWMDFSMQASEASARVQDPLNPWPASMDAYVLTSGTITDTNYIAIPVNAANKEAALVTANYIASASSMFNRAQPEVWGALQAFNTQTPSMKEWDTAFDYIETHEATPTVEELEAGRLGDMGADWVSRINADWVKFVQQA